MDASWLESLFWVVCLSPFWGLIVVLVGVATYLFVRGSKCPKCGERSKQNLVRKEGSSVGTKYYKCPFCNHAWTQKFDYITE